MNKGSTKDALCPSSKYMEGSRLLGIRQIDGSVSILTKTLEIDQTFIENFRSNGDEPEQQFRFTNKCIKNGCKQWTGKECGVATYLSKAAELIPEKKALPKCPIRNECRWHKQEGDKICFLCPGVITTITKEEIDEYFTMLL